MTIVVEGANESRAGENAPLLPREETKQKKQNRFSLLHRALFGGFVISLSFGVTQVPILYAFRLMTCEAYYQKHPSPHAPNGDRCANRDIEAGTARSVALLGASTTIFGLLNLFFTGWTIKVLGVKPALIIQVFWPAMRLAIQNVGIHVGSSLGIFIIQSSQIITVVGGPNGYYLALAAFVTYVTEHEDRTGALGQLQGAMMMGVAVGFLAGGLVADEFGIVAPFRITFALFLLCCLYIFFALPTIPRDIGEVERKPLGITRFFGPLRIFAPQEWTLPDGRKSIQFGALTLGVGVYLAILATGYIPTLIQMYATNEFGFKPSENGGLVFIYSSLRGLYLTFVFPRIISRGRRWTQSGDGKVATPQSHVEPLRHTEEPSPQLPLVPNEIGPIDSMDNDAEPIHPPQRSNEKETFAFDLLYARFSLLLEAILTGLATFVWQDWQLYVFAVLIPFGAGTGAASKGTILQMISSSDRVDGLSGITLVENIARLSTTGVFGLVFAALAAVGQSHLTFACNAAVALVGFGVLLLSRFPPKGSQRSGD